MGGPMKSYLDKPMTWPNPRIAVVVVPGQYVPAEDADLEALGWKLADEAKRDSWISG